MNDPALQLSDPEALAQSLVAEYGATAQNVAAHKLVDAINRNDLKDWQIWLHVRRCVLELGDTARYTRRLSDKLLWSIEQALETDLPQLATLLVVILQEALDAEEQANLDQRTDAPQKRPPLGGGLDPQVPEYTRRLSDKLIWALQQSVEQDRMQIAQSLKPIYEVAAAGEAMRAKNYMSSRE